VALGITLGDVLGPVLGDEIGESLGDAVIGCNYRIVLALELNVIDI
jgi:hypothetical protein